MKLGEIAEIRTGLVLTRKKASFEGDIKAQYRLLSLKNINETGSFNDEPFDDFRSNDTLDEHFFTELGDVLIRLSQPNTAVWVDGKHIGLLVPSSFAIIKVDQRKCLPEYLAWFLNSDEVKKEFERSQAGTRIPTTNKSILETIHVMKVPLEKQTALIEINRLYQREKSLYTRLMQEKERWHKALLTKLLEEK